MRSLLPYIWQGPYFFNFYTRNRRDRSKMTPVTPPQNLSENTTLTSVSCSNFRFPKFWWRHNFWWRHPMTSYYTLFEREWNSAFKNMTPNMTHNFYWYLILIPANFLAEVGAVNNHKVGAWVNETVTIINCQLTKIQYRYKEI